MIIVGGGHNGVTLAAYLAKCGLSVCALEKRIEAGGSYENAELKARERILPHALFMYASPAPGFEQLELRRDLRVLEHLEIRPRSCHVPTHPLSKKPCDIRRAAPCLGGHNHYVYTEILGSSEDEIAEMMIEG